MLSRVADALLWMSRDVERAEHDARVIDVNINLLLDLGLGQQDDTSHYWEPLISVAKQREVFFRLYDRADEQTVPEFFTFNVDNPNSVLATITRARENARTVRESISSEMWEHLNRAYLSVSSNSSRRLWKEGPHAFYQQVKDASHAFQGVTDATMLRGEEWHVIQLGKFLERADNTSRILDITSHMIRGDGGLAASSLESAQWMAVLKSCSAYEAYRRHSVNRIEHWRVTEFLIFADVFPRSIRFSVTHAAHALNFIERRSNNSAARRPKRMLDKVRSYLEHGTVEDVKSAGTHAYLDDLQCRLNDFSEELSSAYRTLEPMMRQGSQEAAQQREP